MRPVRQNDKNGANGAGVRWGVGVLALALLLSGCAGTGAGAGADTAEPVHGGLGAAGPAHGPRAGLGEPAARALAAYASRLRSTQARSAAVARRWGLAEVPLAPPAPPARKPVIEAREGFEVDDQEELGLPPVFTTVPTKDKVVFLTVDDGEEKDPAFLRMMSDLRIPYTAFLSDYLVKDDYGYFRKMRDRGITLDNHTLHHPYMPALSYARQKHEICGMQDVMEKQFGRRPTVFRPPYGNYDQDTLRAAKSCGIKYAPIWNEEVFVDHWEYREEDQDLHPGDIVLTHFQGREEWKGTMPDMVRRFLRTVTAKGYAVARLEDYL
ncbi:polysaccharide deacetylase family protein [Streptomyces sp. NPDC002742]|uniref:polysaccharide deacetylase family protein n=1 Tax=Streptomyces sp. NPDC002742 TaxID=3364663 RepID=UPI0036B447E8